MTPTSSDPYEQFLQRCAAVRLPAGWSRFAKTSGLYSAPDDFDVVFKAMREQFGTRAVIEAGLGTREETGVRPSSAFMESPNDFLPVRADESLTPFDLVTELGSAKNAAPFGAIVKDFVTHDAIETNRFLIASFGLKDLAALRAVGMPVTTAQGLERMTEKIIRDFRGVFGFNGPAPAAVPRRMYLAAWSPSRASRDRSSSVDDVVEALISNESAIGLALNNIFVWQPTGSEMRSIKSCLQLGRRIDVFQQLEASLNDSAALATGRTKASHRADFVDVELRFRKSLVRPDSTMAERKKNAREMRQVINQFIVSPLMKEAADIPDPIIRSRYTALARACELAFSAATVEQARMEKALIEDGLRADKSAFEFGTLMRAFDAIFKASGND